MAGTRLPNPNMPTPTSHHQENKTKTSKVGITKGKNVSVSFVHYNTNRSISMINY